jgi:NRAMP (natural resistance-associated macrophage protein)-like metal ion transporter
VVGSAVAIHLLFGIPFHWAVVITALDVLLLLALQGVGMRFIEAIIVVLVGTIGVCYFIEIFVLPSVRWAERSRRQGFASRAWLCWRSASSAPR